MLARAITTTGQAASVCDYEAIRQAAREAARNAPLPAPDELPDLRRVFAPLAAALTDRRQSRAA
jgi:hypothetical protein